MRPAQPRPLLALATFTCFTALHGCGAPADANAGDAMAEATVDAPPADPVEAAQPRQWTWVPVEGARCLNGSPTGVGLNLAPGSDGLVVFFMGGGACFNADTCEGAYNRDGFDERRFRFESTVVSSVGPLSRDDATNPMRDWNQLYIGYCSGDVHAGDNDRGVEIGDRRYVFTGYRNVGLALARVMPRLRGVRRVLLTGVSAGGFGAAWNYDRIARAFGPSVDVSLVDDSGPPLGDAHLAPCLQQTWRTLWNLDATLPPDCAACRGQADGGGLTNLLEFLARKYPTRRMGLVSSTGDNVIRGFFSWGRGGDCARRARYSADDFSAGLDAVRRRVAGSSFRTYLVASESHTWLLFPVWNSTRVDRFPLNEWVASIATGEGRLADVGPGAPQ